MKTRPKEPRTLPVTELLDNFERQIVETTRRSLAMRRRYPEAVCRWRRAATTGPNSDLALVFTWVEGQPPQKEVWPYARIEQLAAEVSDAEVYQELKSRLKGAVAAEAD